MNKIIMIFPLVLMLTACGDDTDTSDGSCVTMKTGHWNATGNTWGMDMDADVEVQECAITFSNWNMMMSAPTGGKISGDTVTLKGSGKWSGCTGTVKSDTEVEGTCADDSTWGFIYKGAVEGS